MIGNHFSVITDADNSPHHYILNLVLFLITLQTMCLTIKVGFCTLAKMSGVTVVVSQRKHVNSVLKI
uniref:Uncharacterized protein n=1 Tax=Anguilla anguilla TaxID=7936 RepID=A0A0E9XJX8_ANGAN